MLMIISLIFCTHDIFFSFVYFVVNIVYFVVHIVCEVDVIANSLLNNIFFFFFSKGDNALNSRFEKVNVNKVNIFYGIN